VVNFIFDIFILKMSKKAQVWVETVIYTLIGLAIIGILLAVSKPRIDSMKDKLLIEQSIDALKDIDNKVNDVANHGPGNRRNIGLKISKGKFIIDSIEDKLSWILDSEHRYSEPGVVVPIGDIDILTQEAGPWKVILEIDYSGEYDITYDGGSEEKEFESAPSPYSLAIENIGADNEELVIDFREQ
jgi:hypothetical protein